MPRQIKQCAWEIYLDNMAGIYQNAALYFCIRYGFAFLLGRILLHPFLHQLLESLWLLALVPMDLWWRKSLLELVKGERLPACSFLSLYGDVGLCQKGLFLQLLLEGVGLWFWGVGYGLAAGEGAARTLGTLFGVLGIAAPFLLSLTVQPIYVSLLIAPGKPLTLLFASSWRAMDKKRGALLALWGSLAGWLTLLLLSGVFVRVNGLWPVSLLSHGVLILANIAVLPYVMLCEIFFSLRVLK